MTTTASRQFSSFIFKQIFSLVDVLLWNLFLEKYFFFVTRQQCNYYSTTISTECGKDIKKIIEDEKNLL